MSRKFGVVGGFLGASAFALLATGACSSGSSSDAGSGGSSGSGTGGSAGMATGGSGGAATGGSAGMATGGGAGAGTGGAAGAGGAEVCAGSCTCDMSDMCNYDCSGACMVECLGARCTAECRDGDCALDADFGATVSYDCAGGGCTVDCDAASHCTLDCPGGGCDLVCDADSRCTVICDGGGDACNVTCASGGLATCAAGSNCNLTGCVACDPTPDPTYMPVINPGDFTTVIDNPLFPLPVGAEWVYDAPGEVVTVTVPGDTRTVMGVTVLDVHDEVRTTTGELIEDTIDFYAQDSAGNVWYFGEITAEYVNGQIANMNGAWEAGVDGALPGIVMQAAPTVGQQYLQEYYVCQAEDEAEVTEVGASETVPAGSYTGCIRTRDFSRLDPLANEMKTYCPNVGNVLVTEVSDGSRAEELRTVTMP